MRFIRKNGRIIPIRDSAESHRAKAEKGSLVGGVAFGGSLAAGREAGLHALRALNASRVQMNPEALANKKISNRSFKLLIGGFVASQAAGLYSAIHESKARKIAKDSGHPDGYWKKQKEGLKQTGYMLLGAAGAIGAYAGIIKGGQALSPLTKKFAEWAKFKRSTKVAATVTRPVRGLLK